MPRTGPGRGARATRAPRRRDARAASRAYLDTRGDLLVAHAVLLDQHFHRQVAVPGREPEPGAGFVRLVLLDDVQRLHPAERRVDLDVRLHEVLVLAELAAV